MTLKPSAIRHNRNRDMILSTARSIIAEGGIDSLSMRTLADAIDYSPSALYKYFDNKEALIYAIALQGLDELAQALHTAIDSHDDYFDKFAATGRAYLAYAFANPELYKLMFSSPLYEVHTDFISAAQHEDAFQVMVGLFKAGIEAGVFKARPDYGAFEMAFHSWVTVHGLVMLWVTGNVPLPDFEMMVERISQAMVLSMGKSS